MKQISSILHAAVKSIMRNRMRSLLTSLGIIIGVGAVIIMVAIGRGSQEAIEKNINALGTNLIIVFPGVAKSKGVSMGAGTRKHFTEDDVEKVRKEANLVGAISPVVRAGGQLIGGNGNWSTITYGVSPEYLQIRDWEIQYGEPFTERDVAIRRKVVLIGKTVADQLFPDQDPTGQPIRVRNVPCTIAGVLKAKGQNGMGQDQDDVVLAPYTTVMYRLKGEDEIDMINASAVSVAAMDSAQEQIRGVLRKTHRIEEGEDDDFNIANQTQITSMVTATSKTLTMLLGSIAGVSLFVGGIGIMNIMLVSVTERTREIGIRLAVGARGSDVLVQFLTEAVVLSVSGGVIGIIFAGVVVFLINKFATFSAVISPEVVVISFLFSGLVGVFFGFYPARRAAALNPIDALRYE